MLVEAEYQVGRTETGEAFNLSTITPIKSAEDYRPKCLSVANVGERMWFRSALLGTGGGG